MLKRWRIEMFGNLRIHVDDTEIFRFRTRKTGLLIAYLSLNPLNMHSREKLIDCFWPEYDLDAGRNSLRVAISSLRRQLNDHELDKLLFRTDNTHVSLNASYFTSDVFEFDAGIKKLSQTELDDDKLNQYDELFQLYSGSLLSDFDDVWILPERYRLVDTYISSLRKLIKYTTKNHDFERAISFARLAITADPLQEDIHRHLMQLLHALGRRSAALRQYHDLEHLLRLELNTSPNVNTQELKDRILSSQSDKISVSEISNKPPSTAPPQSEQRPYPPQIKTKLDFVGNLPVQFSNFFGREEQIIQISQLILGNESRLLTITGVGGCGKTRLAIEIASRLWESFNGAVWFVPLNGTVDPQYIPEVICRALNIELSNERSAIIQISEVLSTQPSLIILDNLEHLLPDIDASMPFDSSTLLQDISRLTPLTKILITSRRRLDVQNEREICLPPFLLPAESLPLDQIEEYACVSLFIDRAKAINREFQLTNSNKIDLLRLCIQLEGIPLAIELCAAWARIMTLNQMSLRLSHRFDLLIGSSSIQDKRHLSMFSTIDWSYRLLPQSVQLFFLELSIFKSDWSLEAAEAVCSYPHAFEYLRFLQDRSIVICEEKSNGIRFRFLEVLRDFAEMQLPITSKLDLSARHANFFLNLAEQSTLNTSASDFGYRLDCLEKN